MKQLIGTKLYRVLGMNCCHVFFLEEGVESVPYFQECEVVKHTPQGMWLKLSDTPKLKFVFDSGRYAFITREEALKSFIERRVRYIPRLLEKIEKAREELYEAQKYLLRQQESLKAENDKA